MDVEASLLEFLFDLNDDFPSHSLFGAVSLEERFEDKGFVLVKVFETELVYIVSKIVESPSFEK